MWKANLAAVHKKLMSEKEGNLNALKFICVIVSSYCHTDKMVFADR